MKAIINILRKQKHFTEERLHVSRAVFRFSNNKNGLWNGVNRYAH